MKNKDCYRVGDWLGARGLELLLLKWLSVQPHQRKGSCARQPWQHAGRGQHREGRWQELSNIQWLNIHSLESKIEVQIQVLIFTDFVVLCKLVYFFCASVSLLSNVGNMIHRCISFLLPHSKLPKLNSFCGYKFSGLKITQMHYLIVPVGQSQAHFSTYMNYVQGLSG